MIRNKDKDRVRSCCGASKPRSEGGHDRVVEKLLKGLLAYPQGATLKQFYPGLVAPTMTAVNAMAACWEAGWVSRNSKGVYALTTAGEVRAREQVEMDECPEARKRILKERVAIGCRVVQSRAAAKAGPTQRNRTDAVVSVTSVVASLFPEISQEIEEVRKENAAFSRPNARNRVAKQIRVQPVKQPVKQPELFQGD